MNQTPASKSQATMEAIQKGIDIVRSLSNILSSQFGRGTDNPLLKGIEIPTVLKRIIDRHVKIAFHDWELEKTRKSKVTLRTILVYVRDVVEDAIKAPGNIGSDIYMGKNIKVALDALITALDNIDVAPEVIQNQY